MSTVPAPIWSLSPREDDIDSLASAWEADLAILETGFGHWPRPAMKKQPGVTDDRRRRPTDVEVGRSREDHRRGSDAKEQGQVSSNF